MREAAAALAGLTLLMLISTAESATQHWPLQSQQQLGEEAPAEPSKWPKSRGPTFSTPARSVEVDVTPRLEYQAPGRWRVRGWRMAAAAIGAEKPVDGWIAAVVPGTALTTLLANGRYPDPEYGLNNLQIPETLARQDYWFRTILTLPIEARGHTAALLFEGVNYGAEVLVDGKTLGTMRGAFARGRFALPPSMADGQTHELEVRVSPPPRPGFPHEQSLSAGPGNNGGRLAMDGPTFFASEGWDWIPGVRDRNTGIWQDVLLEVSGPVRIGDVDVRTTLPRADNSVADVAIEVPLVNQSDRRQQVTLRASFDDVVIVKTVSIGPGRTAVPLESTAFPALRVKNPRLWWPNGYGPPDLHDLEVTVTTAAGVSDTRRVRFGMREVSYELTVNVAAGRPRRILYRPALASGKKMIAVDHGNLSPVAGGWAPTLVGQGADGVVTERPRTHLAPHMVIRINNIPIAVRGGNWGMDDWLKRVNIERLEPFFRLHRLANLNTIRNWAGQSTESVFFALADQYGLMVLNDFWISTQDFNAEPDDTKLFLTNAEDTISRFRHHPSIVLWLGRNEGVPPPGLNEGMEALVRGLDGTRYYTPNSRLINMADSGPWNYQPPELYFTTLAQGFSTEIGTPSFPTLEAFKAFMPGADQWPVSDTWAYHDWHQAAGGDVAPFMSAMTRRLGTPQTLQDFERKAQLLEYEAHRAIFEGMNNGLFERNSGRLIWMSQPAWPSTNWQMMSHDYDTHGAFWGVARGSEPVHAQMAADTGGLQLVNSLPHALSGLTLEIRAVDLTGGSLLSRTMTLDAPPMMTREATPALLPRATLMRHGAMIQLTLRQRDTVLSRNSYWLSADARASDVTLADMPRARVEAHFTSKGGTAVVVIANRSSVPALLVKLTVQHSDGTRLLPVYLSDNYISLLPGEQREITVACSRSCPALKLALSGWNLFSNEEDERPSTNRR